MFSTRARLSVSLSIAFVTMLSASCGSSEETSITASNSDSTVQTTTAQGSTSTTGVLETVGVSLPASSVAVDDEVVFDPTLLGALGDCFNQGEDALVAVECAVSHDYQLVLADGRFEASTAALYPSEEEWLLWEDQFCVPALESFAGLPLADDVDFTTFRPTAESWTEGDRAVWCAAYRGDAQWSGSLAD